MAQRRDGFEPVLAALSADRTTEFGAPQARVETLRTVDGLFSSVRHVRVHGPARTIQAYIKILKPRRPGAEEAARIDRMLRREYEATRALYDALRQDADVGVVRPIAFLPDHRALVTEEAPGRPLGELLAAATEPSDALLTIARRAGVWVRTYQRLAPSADVVSLAERRHYLDERLALLEGRVLSAAERQAVLDRYDALARRIGPSVPAVRIHADLTPTNIIVDDTGRVTVLDFTMAKSGTPHHDLSHLYFHLELLAGRQRAKREMVRATARAMLAGYDATLSAADPLFALMLMVHGVCHVALLAERKVPLLDAAYRWFLRRRWQRCEQMQADEAPRRVA